MSDELMKNFAMSIPKYASLLYKGCWVINGTNKEYDDFIKWVEEGNIVQLSDKDTMVNVWLETGDLGRRFMRLNDWFIEWKTPKTFSVTTYPPFKV